MIIKKICICLYNILYDVIDYFAIKRAPFSHKKALSHLKGKEKLKCVFFVLTESGWKYDILFQKMLLSDRFDPVVLVCPRPGWGKEFMMQKMRAARIFYEERKGYPTLMAYNIDTGIFLDVKSQISPDLIFYCAPYRSTIDKRYFISQFPDILTVYVPYTFNNSIDFKAFHDETLHNLVWRYYAETDEHKLYSVNNARNKGKNVVVTGYPGIETFLDKNYKANFEDWKLRNESLKRIIWAPHHTIADSGTVIFSCFLRYSEFMVKMAQKYVDKIQFIFKPHPLLRPKLERLWGKSKSDLYFEKWERMPNTCYSEGNYVDMFFTSDAMIHDCGSFISEYLYLNKPVLRTMNDYPLEKMYNPFTQECIRQHYMAYDEVDIERFLCNIIDGVDPMKEQRTHFVQNKLMPKGMPSENILNDIINSIDNQILYPQS